MRLLSLSLLLLPALAQGAWRPIPPNLWAMQAAVPPGTNNTQAVQQVTPVVGGVPLAPNATASPQSVFPTAVGVAVPVGGVTGPSQNPASVGMPSQGGPPPPGSRPVTPNGQIQPLPPGVVPAGQQPQGSGAIPATPAAAPANAPLASAVPSLPTCDVTLRLSRTELPPTGGEFAISTVRKPANCPTSIALSVPWLTTVDPSELRFEAEPNNTGATRDALILIGGQSFLVRQSPPAQVGLAAAPGRLVFGINRKGATDIKILTAWTEQPAGGFIAKPQHPWLVVTPKRHKEHRQVYEVTVKPGADLPPGRHDTRDRDIG